MGVAYRWLRDAGEAVVYLIPDGRTHVTKSERTGCYPDAFARVLAYKEAYTEKAPPCRVGVSPERGSADRGRLRHHDYAPEGLAHGPGQGLRQRRPGTRLG